MNGNLVIKGSITIKLCPNDQRMTSAQKQKQDMMNLLREGKFSGKIKTGQDDSAVH